MQKRIIITYMLSITILSPFVYTAIFFIGLNSLPDNREIWEKSLFFLFSGPVAILLTNLLVLIKIRSKLILICLVAQFLEALVTTFSLQTF